MSSAPSLEALRARVARIERRATPHGADVLRFGVPAIDQHLPGGGLLAQRRGPVLWAAARQDLFAPALAAAGLHPDRIVFAEAGKAVLLVMEEALRVPGLARARWRLDLVRCRGGAPATWTVEACDAQGRLALATDLPHRSDQAPQRATG